MWSPTHVQVLVKRAKGLKVKGKDGTNDAFVTIALGKEKFRTSTKEKSVDPVEWMEQCELCIPKQGNTAEVNLTLLHRNLMGVDEFLGQVSLPLKDFDVYERPKTRWYPLKCKPGQTKTDYRGELEVRLGFTVKAAEGVGGGSTNDLARKNKGSLTSLNKVAGHIGGSLMSLGSKEKKNIKKLVKKASHKVEKVGDKARSSLKLSKDRGSTLDSVPETRQWSTLDRTELGNQDPGVNSDDEDAGGDDDMFKFDTLSQRSNMSELSINRLGRVSNTSTPYSGSLEAFNVETPPAFRQNNRNSVQSKDKNKEEWESKLFGKKGDTQDTLSIASHQSAVSQQSAVSHQSAVSRDAPSLYSQTTPSMSSQATLEDTWKPQLPVQSQAPVKPPHQKKKIIPVQDEIESSPSPESPSSPVLSGNDINPWAPKSKRLGVSASTIDLASAAREQENKKKTLGLKLKNSYSFKEKNDETSKSGRRNSIESNSSRHSRTHSDGSFGPPNGTRIVLGRETSPLPNYSDNIPQDLLAKYNGKSKQELLELVIGMERRLEYQTNKVGDLENYIDSLLIRVMEVAPVLLQKDLDANKANISSCHNSANTDVRTF